ncbi:MAG: ribosome maturation factor RimP [Clostridia bacterium]|nr:ribosome maturation factor RimP [Clostridia bacterium]
MAKTGLIGMAQPRCEKVARSLGYELVDLEQVRDAYGVTLRVYIDKPDGMDLDGCERFHRALIPLVEDLDYDYLEVSSPGIDRPLKKDADFERALGSEVEARFYRAIDGAHERRGILSDWTADTVTLEIGGAECVLNRRDCATIRRTVDMTGVEEVDLGGDGTVNMKPEDDREVEL